MGNITVPWMAEIVLISWRTVRKDGRPPLPSELLATFIAFGSFSLLSNKAPKVATSLGWGIVIATFLNLAPNGVIPQSGAKQTSGKPSAGTKQTPALPAAPATTFYGKPSSATITPKGNVA